MVYSEYTWIFVVSIFLALFVAWGIGANDVSNAFGTSVGAKALTMKQAILVASVLEFSGAMLLGSGVTDTIKSGIADISYYIDTPAVLMYGMLCALAAAGIWLALATFLELPVSTTHSIVGAIIGMSLVAKGPDSVIWTSASSDASPFPGGVVAIVLAWFITPAMAALVAGLLFLFTKVVVMKAKNPFRRSLVLYPIYTFITVWVVTYFIIQKGVNGWMKGETYKSPDSCPPASSAVYKTNSDGSQKFSTCQISDGTNAWISTCVAAGLSIICIISLKWIVKLVERDMKASDDAEEAKAGGAAAAEAATVEAGGKSAVDDAAAGSSTSVKPKSRTPAALTDLRKSKVWTTLSYGANYDIHESVADDAKIMAMHNEAEVFDRKTEFSFKYLQVLTACANSFAHGANDVANSIGSLAAVYAIWECSCANSKAAVPLWMFALGGVGLILGLATYGYKIIRAMGVKMTKLTNSRGYCAELTAAIIVIVASRYGFPVSTTQVITGAITGIGLEEVISAKIRGDKSAAQRFNFKLLAKFFLGWVATLIVAGVTSAAFTAQGLYSPNVNSDEQVASQGVQINGTNYELLQSFSAESAANPTDAALAEQVTALNASVTASTPGPILNTQSALDTLISATDFLNNSTQ